MSPLIRCKYMDPKIRVMVLPDTIWSFQVLNKSPLFVKTWSTKKVLWSTFFLRVYVPYVNSQQSCGASVAYGLFARPQILIFEGTVCCIDGLSTLSLYSQSSQHCLILTIHTTNPPTLINLVILRGFSHLFWLSPLPHLAAFATFLLLLIFFFCFCLCFYSFFGSTFFL